MAIPILKSKNGGGKQLPPISVFEMGGLRGVRLFFILVGVWLLFSCG